MSNPYQSTSADTFGSEFEQTDPSDTVLQRSPVQSGTDQQVAGRTSILGPSLTFKGELVAGEDLLIQDRVEGSIQHTAQNLPIGPEGSVKANIRARAIVVQGTVQGDMHATEVVTIEQSAKVRGNIFAPKIGLHEGATFKGSIDMDMNEEPPAASTSKPTPRKTTRKRSKTKADLEGEDVDKLLK